MAIRSNLPTFAAFVWFLLCITPLVVNGETEVRLQEINNRAAITKTFVSPYGDVVDCVPSLLQPAFSHPSMKGKKLLDPPEIPKELLVRRSSSPNVIFESWMKHQESCPRGTIPIRRATRNDLSRPSKKTYPMNYDNKNETQAPLIANGFIHEYAVGALNGGSYYGTKATINVWSPYVDPHNEFSLAQIWLATGGYATNNIQTVEAGWQVYPFIYGDNNPRLFTYWTADTYKQTGCYDLNCPGFVQTNTKIFLGIPLSPISTYGGKQIEIIISVWKNNKDGNWWLSIEGEVVGYWPIALYRSSFASATNVSFGGEVSFLPSTNHTTTDMGSGHFPNEGYTKAAYFRNLETIDFNGTTHPISTLPVGATRPACYSIAGGQQGEDWGQHFFYGGGGQSDICK